MKQNPIQVISQSIITLSMLLLFSIQAQAIQEKDIASQMKTSIDKTTDLLQNNMIQQEKRNTKIFELFDPIFDYSAMSKIALVKNWKKLSKQQKIDFKNVFNKCPKLTSSSANNIDTFFSILLLNF